MKGAALMWMLVFGAASLLFVFSMEEEQLPKMESDFDLEKGEQSPSMTKRNPIQFFHMVWCATRRNPFDYNGYGNWCGIGGSGTPVDELDRCCYTHDKCYENERINHGCDAKWKTYEYRTERQDDQNTCDITCEDSLGSCGRRACECDRTASLCFANNNYNPSNKKTFWRR